MLKCRTENDKKRNNGLKASDKERIAYGKIDVRFDEKTEAIIKDEAAKMKMNVSDFIRYKLNLKDSSVDQIILSFVREFQQQRVEILEMRKELRLSVGAMIEVLKAHGVTIEEMKQAGLEFFKKSGVKN